MILVLGTLAVFVIGGPSRRVPSLSVPVLPSGADAGLREFSFVQSKNGQVDWRIQAKEAQVFDTPGKAVLKQVQVTLTDAAGVSMKVHGDEGTIDTSSQDFALGQRSGDLALMFEDGYTIYTPHIAWINNEQRFWTDDQVRIIGPSLEITGQGLDAFVTTKEMRVRRNVRAEVH